MEIPPIGVTGTFDGRSGKQEFNVKSAQPLTLQVKPSDPSSTPWLPLETLSLKAKLPPNLRAAAGQPLRLTIEMRAVGSSGSQLPSLEKQLQSPAFRIYREQNHSETKLLKKSDKIIGSRTESFTLVPQYGGELTPAAATCRLVEHQDWQRTICLCAVNTDLRLRRASR